MIIRRIATLSILAAAAFTAAFAARTRADARHTASLAAAPAANLSDSARLAAMGVVPGRQLLAFVLVSAHCGFCRQHDTKEALASLRGRLNALVPGAFHHVTIVAVGADQDVDESLEYIRSIGHDAFDGVNVGNGWLNEELVRLVWRGQHAVAGVPQVVLVSRGLQAQLRPFAVRYDADSLIGVVNGQKDIVDWVGRGANLRDSTVRQMTGAEPDLTSPGANR